MLTYNMDVEPNSTWLRTTPGAVALSQPYHCTEAGLFYGREHFATARTDKESYILFYTLSGGGLVEQGESRLTLAPGQALLLNCRTPHSYCTAPGSRTWAHYWVHIDGAGVRAMEPLLNPQRLSAVSLPALSVREYFKTILNNMQNESTARMVSTGLAIHQLLAAMVGEHLGSDAGAARSNRALVERAADFIRIHYAQPLCLDELLAAAHISKSYFLRLFRQYMGTTPYNFLLCYRITQAKELLVLTDLPVGEVARRVGFGDESNFSTRFAGMAGQSPLQYRKSALKQK
ncbi:MAG: AraC family transcriptional regulator [Gemmiger sp.]|nr:AraC family transcriptional regulator [Gemmiger sp.]